MYSVVDIETTGGKTTSNRITEIAIVITDGKKIIEKFSTLVNPHRKIDKFVIQLTGITDEMVETAPDFSEIIDKIDELTKDTIFVAHNVPFDYSIIKREYKKLNQVFRRNNLCTVQLSRKTLKDQASFSLGKLTESLGIKLENRHRALGDAEATAHLLHYIINKVGEENVLNQTAHKTSEIEFKGEITNDIIEELPEEPGTFRFLDKDGKVIYIGFAKNIFSTVTKLLIQEAKSITIHGLLENMFAIDYEIINSFFIAQLSAISEKQKLKPIFNQKKNQREMSFGVFERENDFLKGPFEADNIRKRKEENSLWQFSNLNAAKRFIKRALQSKTLVIPPFQGDHKEFDQNYKIRLESYLKSTLYPHRNFFIVREVSFANIAYVVWIENFIYKGFGVIDLDYFDQNIETLKDCIKHKENNQQAQKIISKYIGNAKGINLRVY